MRTIHAAYHLTLAWACRIGLAAVFVPSAVLLPAVGSWLTERMWHHDLMASSAWDAVSRDTEAQGEGLEPSVGLTRQLSSPSRARAAQEVGA